MSLAVGGEACDNALLVLGYQWVVGVLIPIVVAGAGFEGAVDISLARDGVCRGIGVDEHDPQTVIVGQSS